MKNKKVAVFLSTAVAAVSGALLYHKKKKQKEDKIGLSRNIYNG